MVSIIVPIYHAQEYLPECIDSILSQTYTDLELLLIDDGSTDSSGEICDRYAARDSRVRVWHIENNGVSNARNVGLQHARGEFIAFCDADDIYLEDYLACMVAAAEREVADIVICSYYSRVGTKRIPACEDQNSGRISAEAVFERIFLCNEIGGFVWNKMFRRQAVKDISFQSDMQICEDTYFVVGAIQNSSVIYYLREPLYEYVIHENSAVNRVDNLITEEGKSKFTQAFQRIMKDHALSETMRQYVQCGIFWMASSVKCDYTNAGGGDKQVIKNLDADARNTLVTYCKCSKIPLRKKVITTANWLLNLRGLKKRIRRS